MIEKGTAGIYHPKNKNYVLPCTVVRADSNGKVDLDVEEFGRANSIPVNQTIEVKDQERWFCEASVDDYTSALNPPDVEVEDHTDVDLDPDSDEDEDL